MWFRVKKLTCIIAVLVSLANPVAAAISVGQTVPDFTLPSANLELGQRLHEQRGKPVMLLVLNRCNQCQNKLLDFQLLASSYSVADLATWVIWQPYKKHLPPQLHIPVLNASAAESGWNYAVSQPTLLFIDREGVLVHQQSGSLKKITAVAEEFLLHWMHDSQARPEGR